jgi:hypothetical protein
MAVWERLRSHAQALDYWPVISSSRNEELLLAENIEASDQVPAAVIAAGLEVDPLQWIRDHVAQDAARATAHGYGGGAADVEGPWLDDTAPSDDFYLLARGRM